MRNRRQQCRTQLLGLAEDTGLLEIHRQLGPLDRDRGLVDDRIEEPAVFRRQLRTLVLEQDAEQADDPGGRPHGNEQPASRLVVGLGPAGGTLLGPCPLGCRPVLGVEVVFGRESRDDVQPLAGPGQQDQGAAAQRPGDMGDDRPQGVVEGHRGRYPAAEVVEVLDAFG